jgi:hypothetical protein
MAVVSPVVGVEAVTAAVLPAVEAEVPTWAGVSAAAIWAVALGAARKAASAAPGSFAARARASVVAAVTLDLIGRLTGNGTVTVNISTIVVAVGTASGSSRHMRTTATPVITATPGPIGPASTTAAWRPTKDGPPTAGDVFADDAETAARNNRAIEQQESKRWMFRSSRMAR